MLLHIILSLLTLALGTLQGSTSRAINNIAKPNCPTHYGNVTVPYPFGIGKDTGCSLDDSFYVTCDTSNEYPNLFLHSTGIEIYNFSESEFRIGAGIANRCYNQDGTIEENYGWWLQLNTFTYSQKNTLTVLGCDDYSLIRGTKGRSFSIGCLGVCGEVEDVPDDGQCSGPGCCKTSIPKGLDFYNISLSTFRNHTDVWSFNRCGYAFLGEEGSFKFRGASDLSPGGDVWARIKSTVHVVLSLLNAKKTVPAMR
ncbi:hypothetical protein L1987_26014 [Smallanthus sonchifolius]|uniref:Uncharacterized protein n=1 Tax=Smallanthus sonchifolius TaxID=185202 RepID=A0ACB9IBM2_9ASTR|nr:hypothetical protein L1987_26014 [Smallanthus sonchifolius]